MTTILSPGHANDVAEGRANNRAIAIFATYLSTIILLVALITQDIIRASLRKRNATKIIDRATYGLNLHAVLAVLCLAVTWYYMISFFSMSYQSWALNHDVALPSGLQAIWADHSIVRLGAWLQDVQLFRDAWEIVVETPGRYFWSQPIFVITTGWSFFIAWKSQMLGIPHAWAYMALGQLVAISFAMNLFFLAVVAYAALQKFGGTNPTKKTSAAKPDEKVLWTPPMALPIGITALTFLSVALIPMKVGTSRFLYYLGIPHALLFVPLLLPYVLSNRFRTIRSEAQFNWWYQTYIATGAKLALGAQVAVFVQALKDDSLGKHLHRHSNVVVGTTPNDTNPIESLVHSLVDHPAVSSVGWDTMLCLLSIFTWLYV